MRRSNLTLVLCGLLCVPLPVAAAWNLPGEPLAARSAAAMPAAPDAFGADSAVIDHPFWPMAPGEVWAFSGTGDRSGELFLYTAADAADTVGSVACLPVRLEYYHGVRFEEGISCLAQDRSGNVWWVDSDESYGQLLWAALELGDAWNYPETGVVGSVTSLDAHVGPLRSGFGEYSGCLELTETDPGGAVDRLSYAPGVGLIQEDFGTGGFDRVPLAPPRAGFGTLQFGAETFEAVEEEGSFAATVVRTGGSEGVVWVEFEVTEVKSNFVEEEEEISYFAPDPKTVYLAPGQTQVVFDVVVLDNTVWNNSGTGTLTLSNPADGAALGERSTATVRIEEDETGEDGGTFIGPCFLDTLTRW